jgi:hypothetical protein
MNNWMGEDCVLHFTIKSALKKAEDECRDIPVYAVQFPIEVLWTHPHTDHAGTLPCCIVCLLLLSRLL